jgi:hypothetical protein
MRLMRGDPVSARRNLAILTSDHTRVPFDNAYQTRMDDAIIFNLFFLIEKDSLPFDAEDCNAAWKIMKSAAQFFENPTESLFAFSAAA